jgi:hypothetical protein
LWYAPEILREKKYGLAADIYYFGIYMWQVFSAKKPYADMKISSAFILLKVSSEGFRPTLSELPSDTSKEAISLMKQFLG